MDNKYMKVFMSDKKRAAITVLSLLWWLASFFYEQLVFEPGAAAEHLHNYILVKLLTLVCIYALLNFFVNAFASMRSGGAEAMVLIYALPLFAAVSGFWAVSDSWPLEVGDQFNILVCTYSYETMDGFFNYLTMYVYMVALNIVPVKAFTVVFKVFLISLSAGYCIYRLRKIYPSVLAFLVYAPFIIPPGLYLSYNIHRCPMYAPLYMFFSCMILCDHLEGKKLAKGKFVLLALLCAVLTQWRSEGIYLVIFAPVLLWLCYRPELGKKAMVFGLAAMMSAQLIVYIPQAIEASSASDSDGGRTMPLFQYLITNMERKGLDKEKNAEDLAIVDKYISVDAIHELNKAGDYNYMDNLIIYSGLRPDATPEDIDNFKSAVIRIVIRNPLVYIKTQLGAWSFISTATYYERKLDVISNIFTDLYMPTVWLLGLWVFMLVKKQWCCWFMTSCHLCHMAITTALLPASYFKYYYSEYLYAIFTLLLVLVLCQKKSAEKKAKPES